MSREDIERLANLLALLASKDGEAENAGRAIGQLARRHGLTGGHLKEMFLSGATVAGPAERQAKFATGEAERLERELATLRGRLYEAESNWRSIELERDALYHQVAALQQTLFARGANARMRRVSGTVVLGAALIAALLAYVVPLLTTPRPPAFVVPHNLAAGTHVAVVRAARTLVYLRPDSGSPVIGTLSMGAPVLVHRVLWNLMMQWAEVEVTAAGVLGTGYVISTDIDLS